MKAYETLQTDDTPSATEACTCAVECFVLAWISGLLTAFLSNTKPAVILSILLLIAWVLLQKRRQYRTAIACMTAGLLLGVAVWHGYDTHVRQPLCAMNGKIINCTGAVIDTDIRSGDRACYTLLTNIAGHRVTIDWYAPDYGLKIGDTVTLDAELTQIQPDYRYHTAEYQAGFGRYLRIYDANLQDVRQDTGFSLRRVLHDYRQRIAVQIQTALPPEDAGLLCAMLFGDKTVLSTETVRTLNQTGIGHITAVSGLHLVFFCTALAWILNRLGLPARLVFLLHIPAIALFILLTDSSVSVYRAAVMILLARSAVLFGRHGSTLRALCLAMFLCTAAAPYVIGSVSFWLSVSGVFGIGILAPYMTKHLKCRREIRTFLSLYCVAAAVFPASVLLCGESSLLSPVCNLILIPICTFILYLGFALLLTGGLAAFLLPIAGVLCRTVRVIAGALSDLPFSHLTISEHALHIAVIISTILLLIFLLCRMPPKQLAKNMLCALCLLLALSFFFQMQTAKQLRIAVLGSGKNAALVISADGRTVIADLSDAPRNAQYVQRYLEQYGITKADALYLHGAKTAAAYQSALSAVKVGSVLIGEEAVLRSGTKICGIEPLMTADDIRLDSGNTAILFSGSKTEIIWHDIRILASETAQPADAAAWIRYGANGFALCLATEHDDIWYEDNLLLRITKDGFADVMQLEP